jgi:hypothetical protein
MTGSIDITLYNIARHDLKLTEAKAIEFVKAIETKIEIRQLTDKSTLATKLDIENVKKEIEMVRKEIVQSKNEMLKWFIGMFVVLAGMIIGLYFKGA